MCELRMTWRAKGDHITNRGNARDAGSVLRVDLDISAVESQSDAFSIETACDRSTPRGHQQVVDSHSLRHAVGKLRLNIHAITTDLGTGHLGASVTCDPLLAERFLELSRDRFVLDRHQSRKQLEDRDLAAEASEDR